MSNKPQTEGPGVAPQTNMFEVFSDNRPALRHYLASLLPGSSEIDDLLQEVFVRVYRADQQSTVHSPKAFMFRTAHNLAMAHIKRQARVVYGEDQEGQGDVPAAAPTVEEKVSSRQRYKIFCDAVQKLPAQCRKVFLLRKYEGLPHKEISAQLGISPKTVEAHLTKALFDCRSYMKKRGVGPGQDE